MDFTEGGDREAGGGLHFNSYAARIKSSTQKRASACESQQASGSRLIIV
jgi:hypothetical protein